MSLRERLARWLRGGPGAPTTPSAGTAVAFGYQCGWLAIRGASPDRVIAALALDEVRPSGWPDGIAAAYEGGVFVSPPADGWVLVVSTALPDAGDDEHADEITPLVTALSRDLDATVQYFGTHRVVEYHAWAWAERGALVRAYAYAGEQGVTALDVGPPTPAEQALELRLFDERSPEAADDAYWERDDLRYPDEDLVLAIAAAWSLDPKILDGRAVADGWLGRWPPGR